MNAKIIPKQCIRELFGSLMGEYTLAAPVRIDGVLTFREVSDIAEVELSDDLPYQSPKEFLFPHIEKIMCFTRDGEIVECMQAKPTIVFGIRPCDLEAIKIMTTVFTTGPFADAYFAKRYESTVLIGLGCKEEKKGCFCAERGIDKGASKDCDLFLTEEDENYVAEAFSEKGEKLLARLALEDAQTQTKREPAPQKPLVELNADESLLFNKVDWEQLSEKCQGCGMCTFICPTCHCFEFRDVEEKGDTTRYKCWDSCMYPKFTMHASGHNPRATKKERYRQRVLHKYLYVKKNFGYTACTGCGRCIRSCPAGMNIKSVVKEINAALSKCKDSL